MTRILPLFPLGSVLVPGAVLPLHVFEPRYLTLMDDLTGSGPDRPPEAGSFGVLLIERGHEVGGGDTRSRVGTEARLIDAGRLPDGRWVVAAVGTGRFVVTEFLADDPYPRARVEDLPDDDPDWQADTAVLSVAERALRRALALAAELGEDVGPVTFDLAGEASVAVWQMCALAPLGPHDRQSLLLVDDPADRLARLVGLLEDTLDVLAFRMGDG